MGDGSHIQHSEQQVDHIAQDSHVSGDAEEEEDEDDGGDYDPESISFDPTPAPAPAAAAPQRPSVSDAAAPTSSISQQRPASKPKTSGGFIMEASDDEDEDEDDDDDDEDEEEDEEEGGAEGEEKAGTAPPIAGGGPSPTPKLEEQGHGPATAGSAVPNANDASLAQAAVPAAGIDPVALLEARVKEDPRGDMDAWLNLIANHKRRNNFDGLRNVYNRFVEVFPQAVRSMAQTRPSPTLLTIHRLMFGSTGWRWSWEWISLPLRNSYLVDVS